MDKVETKQKEIEEKLSKRKEAKKELEKVNQIKKDQKNDLTESKQEVEKEITKLKEQKEEYVAKGNDLEALRSEEHTSELQSRGHLVCRLLLEKKKTRE